MLFFDDDDPQVEGERATAVPYSTPRPLTAAAQRIKLDGSQQSRIDKRKPSAWQTSAWQFFDQIGEIKFAFNLIGQVISQVRIYPAYVLNPDSPPVKMHEYNKQVESDADSRKTVDAMKHAIECVDDLSNNAFNSMSSLLREAAINLSIPGEFYLLNHKGKWHVASNDELVEGGTAYKLKRDRTSNAAQEEVSKEAFVARIWRSHPRYSHEPDSSMLGVLDQCEQLVLLDTAMRILTRSRLNAGALFIPDGVGAAELEEKVAEAATQPLDDESAMSTVVPLLLRGPAELGKEIKYIDLSRRVDAEMLEQQTRALDRVLAGVDIPKDIVQGLSQARYSNAIVISDEMFKSHIEPLILLIVDALTSVVLRSKLKQQGVDQDIADNMVIWYDPSNIVTRPDRSQAANDGYDRKVLSGKAWRSARGFTELDKPEDEELRKRLALEKAVIPPEMAAPMIEDLDPKFFNDAREEGRAATGMPDDVQDILTPGVPGQPQPEGAQESGADDLSGGDISQGGFMPPAARAQ
jgi:hypothetical protein